MAAEPVIWSLGKFDGKPDEFTVNESVKRGIHLKAGVDNMETVPWSSRQAGLIASAKAPYVTIAFDIANEGNYTLKVAIADAKPTPKDLIVWLDNQVIFREPLRGFGSSTTDNNLQYRENIPLKLSPGPHTVGLGCEETAQSKGGSICILDAMSLVSGHDPLIYEVKFGEAENWEAKDFSDVFESRWQARDFTVKVTGLKPGNYTAVLNFQEDEIFEPGKRVFDISANGKIACTGVDIYKEGGGVFKTVTKNIPVTVADDGTIDLHFQATTGLSAIVNEIKILQDGKTVVRKNCGFVPGASIVFATPETFDGRTKGGEALLGMDEDDDEDKDEAAGSADTMAKSGKGGFTGVNIVENGDFEDPAAESGYPAHWGASELVSSSGKKVKLIGLKKNEYWHQGEGKVALDTEIKHSGMASVRISETKGLFGISQGKFPNGWTNMDWTRPYELVAWVKANKSTGSNNLRVDWATYVDHSKGLFLRTDNFALPNGTYDWKEFRVALNPPTGASALSAALTSTDNSGTLWADDMSVDGFGTLPAEVIVSQGGFYPNDSKEAIVFTREDYPSGTFQVIPAGGGKAEVEGGLEKIGFNQSYGRYVWRATFSKVAAIGKFAVKANFPGGISGKSFSFPINKNIYGDIAKLNLNYFHVIQANIAIPGWHGADNLDDAAARNNRFNAKEPNGATGPHIPALGNYYDAGDYSKKPMGAIGAVALAELDDSWKSEDQKFKLSPSDPMAVALHGAEFFKSTQRPDGGFYSAVLRHDKPSIDPANQTDNVVGTPDDGILVASPQPGIPYALARFAVLLNKRDPKLAMEYAHVADRGLTPVMRYWENFGGEKAAPYQKLAFDPVVAGAAINLNQLMPERTDLKEVATRYMQEIVALVNDRVFDDKHYWLITISTHNGVDLCHEFGFAMAMLDYIEAYPNDPLTPTIKSSLSGFIDKALLPSMATNPFGTMGEITADQKDAKAYISPRYHNSTVFGAGYILARAAIALNQPQWLTPAERQVQSGLGFNSRAVSFCMGVGEKNAATRTHLSGVPGHEDGTIVGGVSKGMAYQTGRRGLAAGYPSFSGVKDVPRDGHTPSGQEYWQVISAYFLLAVQEIQKAHTYFDDKSASGPIKSPR